MFKNGTFKDFKKVNYNLQYFENNQKSKKSHRGTKSSNSQDNFQEESMCVTEENRFENVINPIKLADIEWEDSYKLNKLITQ